MFDFKIGGLLPMSSQLNLLAQTTPFVVESSQLVLDQTASELSSFAFTQFPVSLLCLKKKISCKSTERNESEGNMKGIMIKMTIRLT